MPTIGEIIKDGRTAKGWSQEQLANASKIHQSVISKLERGLVNETAGIVRLALALGLNPLYLETGDKKYENTTTTEVSRLGDPQVPDEFHFPISNAAGAMGDGSYAPDFEIVVDSMRVTRSWVRMELPFISNIENLAILPAVGDSMTPTYNSGDLLLIDRGAIELQSSSIYAFTFANRIFVKRLSINPVTNVVHVKSDNPLADNWDIDESRAAELIIHGRVVYAWKAQKL